jgi:hypothetical protein
MSPGERRKRELSVAAKSPAMSGAFALTSASKSYRFVAVILATKPLKGL